MITTIVSLPARPRTRWGKWLSRKRTTRLHFRYFIDQPRNRRSRLFRFRRVTLKRAVWKPSTAKMKRVTFTSRLPKPKIQTHIGKTRAQPQPRSPLRADERLTHLNNTKHWPVRRKSLR